VGRTTEPLIGLGLFDGKNDLGWHSEATPPGLIRLVREGVVTGKHKTIDRGKVVVTSIGGASREDIQWVHMNPLFRLKEVEYVESPLTLASLDNLVCINNALMVDMSGQIASETIGTLMRSAAGGQTTFAVGAYLSKGGRFVIVMPSTARGGTISRIVPNFPEGTQVTVPKSLADIVVTEHGIAELRGKTLRKRAELLISIAAPEFRTELEKEARKLMWP
jgi:4-hydroxybutyrate CoA-transferase